MIAVSDTGPGIAADDQERIFEEFQQARDTNGERPEGTGLGLALSRSLVELHGGPHLGRVGAGPGHHIHLHPARGRRTREGAPRQRRSPRLTAKYVAVFILLVAVPAMAISCTLLDSSYNRKKRTLIRAATGEGEVACGSSRPDAGRRDRPTRSTVGIAALGRGRSQSQRDLVLRPARTGRSERQRRRIRRSAWPADDGVGPSARVAAESSGARDGTFGVMLRLRGVLRRRSTGLDVDVAAAENYGGRGRRRSLCYRASFADLIGGARLGRAGYAYAVDRAGAPVAVPRQDAGDHAQARRRVADIADAT